MIERELGESVRTSVAEWRREHGSFAPFTARLLAPSVGQMLNPEPEDAMFIVPDVELALAAIAARGEILRLRLTEQGAVYVAGLQTTPCNQRVAAASRTASALSYRFRGRKAKKHNWKEAQDGC